MKTRHNFAASLRLSQSYADAPWWGQVYRAFFPTFKAMTDVRDDGWAQRGGIDRLVILASGKHLYIDEKVRAENWDDVLLEYWSDERRKVSGWIATDSATDYIAYAFIPSRKCLLLPFPLLRRAWFHYRKSWVAQFPRIEALNEGYTTVSVAVPITTLFETLRNVSVATWAADQPAATVMVNRTPQLRLPLGDLSTPRNPRTS